MKSDVNQLLKHFNDKNNFGRAQGVRFEVHDDDTVHLFMTIQDHHLSSPGVAHGGAISGFMDSVLGVTALYEAFKHGNICSTVEFKLNFIKPVYLGDQLCGQGFIDYKGQSLVVVSGDIRDAKTNAIKAKGLGTFNLYPLEKKEFLTEFIQERGDTHEPK